MKKVILILVSTILMAMLAGCKDNLPTATLDEEGTETIITEKTITENIIEEP